MLPRPPEKATIAGNDAAPAPKAKAIAMPAAVCPVVPDDALAPKVKAIATTASDSTDGSGVAGILTPSSNDDVPDEPSETGTRSRIGDVPDVPSDTGTRAPSPLTSLFSASSGSGKTSSAAAVQLPKGLTTGPSAFGN